MPSSPELTLRSYIALEFDAPTETSGRLACIAIRTGFPETMQGGGMGIRQLFNLRQFSPVSRR